MTWEIIAALIVLIGCMVSLGKVLARLVATLTRLEVTLDELQRAVRTHDERIQMLEHGKQP